MAAVARPRNKRRGSAVRSQMSVDKPTAMQILVAWRANKWVVARNAVEVGAYAYRVHALARARALAAEAEASGLDCYMLIREQDGSWSERPCPKPERRALDR